MTHHRHDFMHKGGETETDSGRGVTDYSTVLNACKVKVSADFGFYPLAQIHTTKVTLILVHTFFHTHAARPQIRSCTSIHFNDRAVCQQPVSISSDRERQSFTNEQHTHSAFVMRGRPVASLMLMRLNVNTHTVQTHTHWVNFWKLATKRLSSASLSTDMWQKWVEVYVWQVGYSWCACACVCTVWLYCTCEDQVEL